MYYNDIMSQKARTVVAKIRRQSRVRPYRERAEITPLLATVGTKPNGKSHGTAIQIDNQLYPIVEDYEGDLKIVILSIAMLKMIRIRMEKYQTN